jgi:hypothetical protein
VVLADEGAGGLEKERKVSVWFSWIFSWKKQKFSSFSPTFLTLGLMKEACGFFGVIGVFSSKTAKGFNIFQSIYAKG